MTDIALALAQRSLAWDDKGRKKKGGAQKKKNEKGGKKHL